MWPIHIILNKLLKTEEEEQEQEQEEQEHEQEQEQEQEQGGGGGRGVGVGESIEEHSSLAETYPFQHSLYNRKKQDAVLPRSHSVEVPHINQLYSWDCGLACVLMVLRTIGIDQCDMHALWEICSTTSIWTVDLAYLLDKFSVSFSFFTVTVGANPDFSVETFYKEQLPNDLLRVDRLFQQALDSGINISISSEELSVLILSGSYIAIALVDQYKLSRSWLEDVCVSSLYGGNSGYTGHYVVICGYDADKDEFEIRDPARSRKFERVSLECLEEARKSFGTDEDLLLISLEKREGRKQALSVTVTR